VSIPFDATQGLLARQRSARAPQTSVGVAIKTTELDDREVIVSQLIAERLARHAQEESD
jgi:hypothetical protein